MSTYTSNILEQDGTVRIAGYTNFPDVSSGGQPCTLRGPFAFTFATAGLTSGVPIYTPAVGDVIYDIGVSVTTAFNGTTPKADVGTFNGGNSGLFDELGGAVIDLTGADAAVTDNAGVKTSVNWLSQLATTNSNGPYQLHVTAANALLLVVSETGAKGGTATGATAGVGAVYVVTATPVPF